MPKEKYDRYTLQYKSMNGWCVYGWSTYPEHSVLAGQPQKCFIDSYGEDKEAAEAAYPQAKLSNQWAEPQVSLSHLPGEDDPVPGGMYPDDI